LYVFIISNRTPSTHETTEMHEMVKHTIKTTCKDLKKHSAKICNTQNSKIDRLKCHKIYKAKTVDHLTFSY